jgi:hypothetical protein
MNTRIEYTGNIQVHIPVKEPVVDLTLFRYWIVDEAKEVA